MVQLQGNTFSIEGFVRGHSLTARYSGYISNSLLDTKYSLCRLARTTTRICSRHSAGPGSPVVANEVAKEPMGRPPPSVVGDSTTLEPNVQKRILSPIYTKTDTTTNSGYTHIYIVLRLARLPLARCQTRFWTISPTADTTHCGAVGCSFPPTVRRGRGSTISTSRSCCRANWRSEDSKRRPRKRLFPPMILQYVI